jgi:hypothetical protein
MSGSGRCWCGDSGRALQAKPAPTTRSRVRTALYMLQTCRVGLRDPTPHMDRPTSTRGVRARIRRVAGCAPPTGSAGHAGATANLKLTLHLGHSAGADHRDCLAIAGLPQNDVLANCAARSSGDLLPPPPAEQATARQDQAGKGRTGQVSCPCPGQRLAAALSLPDDLTACAARAVIVAHHTALAPMGKCTSIFIVAEGGSKGLISAEQR